MTEVPLHVLLIALGSHGDVHPFVGIGLALRQRGHRVQVAANPYFGSLIKRVGLEFLPAGDESDYRRVAAEPRCWKRLGGTRIILQWVATMVRPVYELVRDNAIPGRTVVATSSLGLGARVAQDHLRIPTASIHLQPSIIMSPMAPPRLGGIVTPDWYPMWLRRAEIAMVDRACDPLIAPAVNCLRGDLGMPPVGRVMTRYLHSPRRVIGLFPEWFAPPLPDWPAQVRLTGFPLFDEGGVTPLHQELQTFLDEGEAPIAFTPGSAMWCGHRFFAESARACALLGRRGLLLSRHADHIPRRLPPGVRHVSYAPFSQLLPRCAAIVHHAGIGTSAQALRAGIAQLLVPHAHDQHDNTAHLIRLGVAKKIEPRAYSAGAVATRLEELIVCEKVRTRSCQVKGFFDAPDPMVQTCEWIERLIDC
jgi:UDP:flavonoid glycosyltransferase YjiC (YdhE family)